MTGISSLADAATPSWSNTSEEISNWEDSDKDESEDMRMLKAVEELGRVEQAKQKLRGKRKIFDSGDDTSYTNGLSMATPESDDEWEYEGWSHLMANDIVPVRRDDVPAQPLTLENEIGGPSSAPKDISEAVLAYHRENVATPDADENISEDNDSLLGLSDAEPVFDDVYNLTFVDGAAPASSEEDAIYIGRIFKDKNHMQTTLAIYAIKRLFHFKQTRSDPGRLIFHCVDRKCPWRVNAVSAGQESKNFEVRTLTLTHTCNIASRSQYQKQATSKLIAKVLEGKYANGMPGPRAVDIPDIVLGELKVSVSYMKAWYAKEAAIMKTRGSDEDSYKLLSGYLHLLQIQNPGTLYKLQYTEGLDGKKQFKYFFFALGASIAGVKYMRKVVLVDGFVDS